METSARARALLPLLLALPAVPPLFIGKLESSWPAMALVLTGWIGLVAMVWRYRRPPSEAHVRVPGWGPAVVLGGMMAAYVAALATLAVLRHHNLQSGIKDLGIYDSIFWHTTHGAPLGANFVKSGNHAAAHVDPILILLSPLYLLYPRAELLLVLQSVWLASGAIPAWLLARQKLGGPWPALVIAAVYLLTPALHGTNLYDFHSLALIAPLVLWAVHFLELGAWRRYLVVLVLLLLCREDVSLLCCGIGLWVIGSGKGWRLGLGTIALSVSYLAFIKLAVMPDPDLLMANSGKSYGYGSFYSDFIPKGKGGVGTLITNLVTHPLLVPTVVFTGAKILFFLKLFVPLLFLPLLAPRRGWLLLMYGFAFLFLASRSAVYSTNFQYAVLVYPLAVALVPITLANLPNSRIVARLRLDPTRLRSALLLGLLVESVAVSSRFGVLWPNHAVRPGGQQLIWGVSAERAPRYAWVKEAIATIPADASVAATFRLGAHVSNRARATEFEVDRNVDYMLLDTAGFEGNVLKQYEKVSTKGQYELLRKQGSLELWKKKPKPRKTPR